MLYEPKKYILSPFLQTVLRGKEIVSLVQKKHGYSNFLKIEIAFDDVKDPISALADKLYCDISVYFYNVKEKSVIVQQRVVSCRCF